MPHHPGEINAETIRVVIMAIVITIMVGPLIAILREAVENLISRVKRKFLLPSSLLSWVIGVNGAGIVDV